ncbi:MAG: type I secretion system permease/ATPase [Geminicoccaceae bacterium]|nr:type I secretion system permease/ATPase [Geminicoccaceae bacterium]
MHPDLADALRACRRGFCIAVVFSLATNLLSLAMPLYMLQLYGRVVASGNGSTLAVLTIAVGIALVARAALEMLRRLLMVRLGIWFERRMGAPVLAASLSRAARKRRTPSVQALRDLTKVREFASGSSLFALLDIPWTLIFVAVLFLLHPLLGSLTLAGGGAMIGLACLNEAASRGPQIAAADASSLSLDRAAAAMRNAEVVEAMGMRRHLLALWDESSARYLAMQETASGRGGLFSALAKLLRYGLQVGILALGAYLAINGEISSGAMITAMLLMRQAIGPMDSAIGSWRSFQSARHALGRVRERLGELPRGGVLTELPPPASGRLEVRDLSFGYDRRESPLIKGLAFDLEGGACLGLVGPTAAGKSTLVRILVGVMRADTGVVRLDGVDMRQWDSEALGPHIGFLPQEVELFGGTIACNIARMAEPDTAEVLHAANLADVHEMITRLPQGYDSEVGDGGVRLSGGQRQRIGLARAVYGLPKLVVLDEPDANLDREGKRALGDAIERLKRAGSSVILVTHRPSLLRHADRVLLLAGGGRFQVADIPRDGVYRLRPLDGRAPARAEGPTRRKVDHERARPLQGVDLAGDPEALVARRR